MSALIIHIRIAFATQRHVGVPVFGEKKRNVSGKYVCVLAVAQSPGFMWPHC